jgi:hypothetical protein
MAYNFLACDRDQAFLLPPDLRDWLPADHLAWFILDVVDQLDLGPFLTAYRADGTAAPPTSLGWCWPCCCTPTAPGSAPPAGSNGAARKTSPSAAAARAAHVEQHQPTPGACTRWNSPKIERTSANGMRSSR